MFLNLSKIFQEFFSGSMAYYNVTGQNTKLGNVAILIAKRVKIDKCLKYYNVLKLESRFTLGLNAAKNIAYIKIYFK